MSPELFQRVDAKPDKPTTAVWSWYAAIAWACFFCAAVAGLAGGLVAILSRRDPTIQLGWAGAGLLLSMVGLLLVGRYCLDEVVNRKRAMRSVNRRRSGI